MKRTIVALGLSVAFTVPVFAQQSQTRASGEAATQTSAAASNAGKTITLYSGTRLAGDLQNTIDVRKAKVGDQVVLKTTQAIKSGGHTVVKKGSRLIGHITEVAQRSRENGASRVGILFDRLEQGALEIPIIANVSSVTSATTNANASGDGFGSSAGAGGSINSSSSARSAGGGNSGLLGGVGSVVGSSASTVGGVVGGATSAVGSTVDSLGNTTSGVGRSLGGIQISQSSSTSVEGSSVLSLSGGNLRLEKGTHFNLVLTQSASASTGKNQ